MATQLQEKKVVANADTFLREFLASGGALAPGDFTMRNEMKNSDAVAVLLNKDQGKVMYFALSAGLRIGESLQAISEGTGVPVSELKALSESPAQFGVPAKAKNLEGFLAPGEYRFPLGTPAKDVLQKLVTTTLDELKSQGVTDPAKQYDVVTVASIVQAEGGQAEYGDVAGAIYNRLKPNNTETNGLIQSDATVTYGLGIKSFHIDEDQKADKSNPYNTYANQGLPVGPDRLAGQDGDRRGREAQDERIPLLGDHQPGHQGDQVLQDAGGAQRLRRPVQRLVRGQPRTLRMTLRAAVLGHPISHSKSPALHRAAYAHLGVELDYSAIDVTEDALPAFMARVREDVRQGESWRGLSVTMPLKSGMVREVDEVRGVARALGVVNTVAFERPAAGAAPVPRAWSATTPTSPASSTRSATRAPRPRPPPSSWAAAAPQPLPSRR